MEQKIYFLDNASTTKMNPEAIEKVKCYLDKKYYNPSAVYECSVEVRKKISEARDYIFDSLGADLGQLIFTGSATEANNMAIFSNANLKKRMLFGAGEHPSVLECAKELKNRGYKVEFVPLDKSGCVDKNAYKNMLGDDVGFISIQHVSNETGAINDIKALVKLARKNCENVVFHCDGVQAFCKLDYSIAELDVDYYTISAHKIGGPKGIGALYVRKGKRITPIIYGGGQENGLRSGTENVFNILGFAEAARIMKRDQYKNEEKLHKMKAELLSELKNNNIEYLLHGDNTIDNIMSIVLSKSVRGETLLHALEKRGVMISTGSACSSSKNYNTTLEAMGVDKEEILRSNRISLSAYEDFDAKEIAKIIKEELTKLEGRNYGKMFID